MLAISSRSCAGKPPKPAADASREMIAGCQSTIGVGFGTLGQIEVDRLKMV